MGIRLEPGGSRVSLRHRLTNIGKQDTPLAPWALTVMAPGGVEVIPLPEHRPHPGPVKNAKSPEDYASNLTMVLWPYFDFTDPRWHLGSKYITLRQDASRGPTKIGLAHQLGWVAYLNDGTLFIKRFPYEKGKHYPDHGCNFETFPNQEMQEMESLGPLAKLAPGQSVEHIEHWELVGDVQDFTDEAGIEKTVRPKVADK